MSPGRELVRSLQDEATDWADAFVRRQAASPEQEALLLHAIHIQRVDSGGPSRALIQLPLLVHGCITGNMRPAIPIAAAGHFLDRSIAILDAFMDGDPMPEWTERGPGEALLAATTVLGAFPQIALAELERPGAEVLNLQRILAVGGLRVSHGQQLDLSLRGNESPNPEDALAAARGKTGEMMATLAELAARLACDDGAKITAYAAIGRDWGTAWQIDSDLRDLLASEPSRDLINGTRTLPISVHIADAHQSDEARLPRATTPEQRRNDDAWRRAIAYCISVITEYCDEARSTLQRQSPLQPAAGELAELVAGLIPWPDMRGDQQS